MSGEYFRDSLGLDGGWGFIAQSLDCFQHRWAKAQFVKCIQRISNRDGSIFARFIA